ncbi:S8/S53 family peptidase [uncultured Kordia sp.]|uniref:S8 family peptidase n=1 Tax=uncultured Kordia sp. TaxID=507699 RepID=UPI002637DDC9|nr:S8/S53 family peptidase [uncultured Kordia sp.]
MKKIGYFIIIICLLSCEQEIIETTTENQQQEQLQSRTPPTIASKKGNTVVIRFAAGLSEAEKTVLRTTYGVTDYEKCSCGDKNLESWDLEAIHEGATIEERVTSMEDEPEMEGADFNFDIQISSQVPTGVPLEIQHYQSIFPKIRSNNASVTVGVLDTGINPTYFRFEQPFLHNSALDQESCGDEFFGWNFVDNNNEPFDDNGHGTIVSYMIYEQLIDTATDFEILPAKAFDADGKSSLFRIGCGLSYLIMKDVNVINMSFGWTTTTSTIIGSYITEVEERILIVASAGNTGENNDNDAHFPSSYPTKNILAVTAVDNAMPPNLEPIISNYGPISVDIAVHGIGLPFYMTSGADPILVTGSSYSSAKVAGFSASKYQEGMPVSVLYHKILMDKIESSTLSQIKYASYLNL